MAAKPVRGADCVAPTAASTRVTVNRGIGLVSAKDGQSSDVSTLLLTILRLRSSRWRTID